MAFDLSLFSMIRSVAGRSVLLDFLGVFFATYLPYILVFAAFIFIFRKRGKRERVSLFLLLALSALTARGFFTPIFHFFYARPRPFDVLELMPLVAETGNSFPSAHAALFFSLGAAIWWCNKKWGWWFLGLAFLNGIARIYAGVHWPTDVLGGIAFGGISLWIVWLLVGKYFPKDIIDEKQKEAAEESIAG